MMRARFAFPHIVINTPETLLGLLPTLEHRIVFRFGEAGHEILTRRTSAATMSAPLLKSEHRAETERNRAQQAQQ
jgi:hypothetical protein